MVAWFDLPVDVHDIILGFVFAGKTFRYVDPYVGRPPVEPLSVLLVARNFVHSQQVLLAILKHANIVINDMVGLYDDSQTLGSAWSLLARKVTLQGQLVEVTLNSQLKSTLFDNVKRAFSAIEELTIDLRSGCHIQTPTLLIATDSDFRALKPRHVTPREENFPTPAWRIKALELYMTEQDPENWLRFERFARNIIMKDILCSRLGYQGSKFWRVKKSVLGNMLTDAQSIGLHVSCIFKLHLRWMKEVQFTPYHTVVR